MKIKCITKDNLYISERGIAKFSFISFVASMLLGGWRLVGLAMCYFDIYVMPIINGTSNVPQSSVMRMMSEYTMDNFTPIIIRMGIVFGVTFFLLMCFWFIVCLVDTEETDTI